MPGTKNKNPPDARNVSPNQEQIQTYTLVYLPKERKYSSFQISVVQISLANLSKTVIEGLVE